MTPTANKISSLATSLQAELRAAFPGLRADLAIEGNHYRMLVYRKDGVQIFDKTSADPAVLVAAALDKVRRADIAAMNTVMKGAGK